MDAKTDTMMKKYLLLLLAAALALPLDAQEPPTPAEGKSMVYFIRKNGVGALMRFRIFDGSDQLASLPVNAYLAYECDPGAHAFIATGENTEFLDAELESGKSYAVMTESMLGLAWVRVRLVPLDVSHRRYAKLRTQAVNVLAQGKCFRPGETLPEEDSVSTKETPERMLERFAKKRAAGEVTVLGAESVLELSPEEWAQIRETASASENETL